VVAREADLVHDKSALRRCRSEFCIANGVWVIGLCGVMAGYDWRRPFESLA
jgi:hypothetical protein